MGKKIKSRRIFLCQLSLARELDFHRKRPLWKKLWNVWKTIDGSGESVFSSEKCHGSFLRKTGEVGFKIRVMSPWNLRDFSVGFSRKSSYSAESGKNGTLPPGEVRENFVKFRQKITRYVFPLPGDTVFEVKRKICRVK